MDNKDTLAPFGYYLFEDETGKITVVTKNPDQIINIKGIDYMKTDNSYKEIIRYMFRKSDAAMKDIDYLQFTQKSMIDITKDYHKQICTNGEDCIVFTGTPDKRYYLLKFSVYAGYQIYHDFNFGDNWSPMIGGRMNVTVPRFNKYLSFQLDLSISRTSGKYSEYIEDIDLNKYNYEYEYSQLLSPIKFGFKYTFGKYNLRPSVELGGVFHSYVNANFTQRANNVEISQETYNFGGAFGLNAGCGLEYALKNKHAIFTNIDIDASVDDSLIQFKLGYTVSQL